jgi:hypothetical protein
MDVEYDDEVAHCPSSCHNPYHEHVDQDHDDEEREQDEVE